MDSKPSTGTALAVTGIALATTLAGFGAGWVVKPTPEPVERIVTKEISVPVEKTVTVEVPVEKVIYVTREREARPHSPQCVMTTVGL